MKNTILKVSALLVLIAVQPAVAKAEITVLGGINMAKPSVSTTPATTTASSNALGLGLLWGKKFGAGMFGIETGLFYFQEKFAAFSMDWKTKRLHVPLMFRLNPVKFLSIGAGGYYENGTGDVDVSALGVTVTQSYADSGLKKSDYGLDFDLRIKIPFGPMVAFVIDGRYQLGLAERLKDTTGGASYKSRSIQALGGFSFGM